MTIIQSPLLAPTSPDRGFFHQPLPKVYLDSQIKSEQVIEVRPFEPIYIFVEMRMGANRSIAGLNKTTPFTVEPCERPQFADAPRCMGQWCKVSVSPDAKPGTTDRISIASRGLYAGGRLGAAKHLYFTLEVGHVRCY